MKSIGLYLSLAFFFLFCFSFTSQAQETHFRLGIKAGVDFDRNEGVHLKEEFKGYFLGGAYLGFQVFRVRIQAEALFSQNTITTGPNFKEAFKNYISENGERLSSGTFKVNELSIPLIFGYSLIPHGLWIEVGPQYTSVISVNDVDEFLKDVDQVLETGYVSGLVGLGIELPLNLNLDVRCIFSISDRNQADVPEHWRNERIQAAIGLTF